MPTPFWKIAAKYAAAALGGAVAALAGQWLVRRLRGSKTVSETTVREERKAQG